MDTINYEGTVYTKASVLAKRFRYTSDYIGQLCRSGKIDSRLVGRSWYVNEAALIAHKESKYKPIRGNEITTDINISRTDYPIEEKVEVRPRLARVTAKMVQSQPSSTKHFALRLASVPVRYEPDESELLPQPVVNKRIEPVVQKIDILPAEAKKLRITITDKPTTRLDFTPLPEVQLTGMVNVVEISPEIDESVPEPVHFDSINPVLPSALSDEEMKPSVKAVKTKSPVLANEVVSKQVNQPKKITFTPNTVNAVDVSSRGSWAVVSITVVTLSVLLFTVLTLTSNVIVIEGTKPQSRVDFNLANLALLRQLFE